MTPRLPAPMDLQWVGAGDPTSEGGSLDTPGQRAARVRQAKRKARNDTVAAKRQGKPPPGSLNIADFAQPASSQAQTAADSQDAATFTETESAGGTC